MLSGIETDCSVGALYIRTYVCYQVTKTDDGLEAIVFTAQGDMRQVRSQ